MSKCNCKTFYLLASKRALCLHQLFAKGFVGMLVRFQTYKGVEFFLYQQNFNEGTKFWNRGWWVKETRTQLRKPAQVLLAIELADKYGVRKVKA